MGVAQAKSKTLAVLLQQEPGVPMEDFSFDATEVIKEVKSLKPGFEGKAKDLKVQEAKDHGEHTLLMQALLDEKKKSEKALEDANKAKADDMKKIAESQGSLTTTSAQMMDDQTYLKELTEVCNAKSKQWDQRSKMRQDELTALTSALTVVKERVVAKATEKTVRLLQGHAKVSQAAPPVDEAEAEEAPQPPRDEDQDA